MWLHNAVSTESCTTKDNCVVNLNYRSCSKNIRVLCPTVTVKSFFFSGIDTFKGEYFHSRDYKSPGEWRNKKAIVVGIGNSGADIAVELSRVTKQVCANSFGHQSKASDYDT